MRTVTFFDGEGMHEGALMVRDGAVALVDGAAEAPRLAGIVTGLFTDHHVHLQLVDHTLLADSRLGRVVDLGADPAWIEAVPGPPAVEYAGPFLTAPGGYPSDRSWAPRGSVREVPDAQHAARVVDELAAAGVSMIKVVAHGDAGPVLDDETFRAIVHQAALHRLPVVAHAEGAGQAQRAARLGATRLAHAPFSEPLSDAEIAAHAASISWISTMAIHDGAALAIVTDNVRRFTAAGGEVLYGTDMGNGPTPVDLRTAEVDALRSAGIDGLDLLASLAPAEPFAGGPLLLLPDGDPTRARRLTIHDLTPDITEP